MRGADGAERRLPPPAARAGPPALGRAPEGWRTRSGWVVTEVSQVGPRTNKAMDFAQRLNHLESIRDWQGLAEELEKAIAAEQDPVTKAAYHLRLGRVLQEKFLHAVRALKHFQDA